MSFDKKKVHTGKVIYWNFTYGFIECPEFEKSIFFHSSNLSNDLRDRLKLLDILTFTVSESTSEKHRGGLKAHNLNFMSHGNLKEYQCKIGTIYNWNEKFGFIDYPTTGKQIFLFHTRLVYSKKVKNGQLVVFNPVKSKNDQTQLFAFFAYPITFEKDLTFLNQQYSDFQIPALKDYINQVSNENKELSISEKFGLELINSGFVNNTEEYISLIKLINKYKTQYTFKPDFDTLKAYVAEPYLIQLWETDVIASYDLETIKDYFISSSADDKRIIATKVSLPDRDIILANYFDFLEKSRKIEWLNNDTKTLLSIVHCDKDTRLPDLYDKIKSKLLSHLKPVEIMDLWLHEFIDNIPDKYIIENFDLSNFKAVRLLLQKKDENGEFKHKDVLQEILEQYLLEIVTSKELDFEAEYPKLIRYLQVFEKEFSERFGQIIKLLNISLTSYQKFVIWIFGVDNNFDAFDYVTNNQDVINDYFKIKFLLRYKNDNKNVKIDGVFDLIKITQNALIKFAVTYKWNGLLYPTENFEYQQINSYLSDIDTFNKIFSQNLDVPEIAQCIYESMEKYNEIHLRLWLYGHLDNTFYNFIGFRNSFKKLTSEEQKSFRVKAIRNSLIEISNEEMMEVIPCSKFDLNTDGSKTYFAVMENLYFSLRHIKLRKENGLFTELFDEPFSSSGLNRIPSNHYLNKIPFQIIVNSNTIISTLGLDKLFITIHTGEIEKALGGVIDPSDVATVEQKSAYVEDMPLRKKIIDFLNQNQVSSMIPTIVIEPKNHFRRLDSNSIIDIFEKTELITIETIDGFGIVWENIDLSGDRATYIFKTLAKNHHLQIEKISHAIVSQAQLRSTLSSTKDDDLLHVFKDDLGYIGSLRKQRGKNDAFENWLKKFEKVLKEPIPELPSVEDSEKLKDWSPENDHHAKITKPRQKKINEDSLATLELFDVDKKNAQSKPQADEAEIPETLNESQEGQITKRKSLLNSLKKFNEYFTDNLNLN